MGGFTGVGARTVIPAAATAKVSLRLVPDQTVKTVARQLAAAVQRLAPKDVDPSVHFLHGADPAQVALDAPAFKILERASTAVGGPGPVPPRPRGRPTLLPALRHPVDPAV